ncbi:MAG TPA: PAP2 family protein, partial [Mycobacterium sp.]|nr:PAP2 family protein [Mycobacterium sp.]
MLTVDQPYGFGADRFGPISAVVVAMLVVLVAVAAWIACRPQLVRHVGKRVRDGAPLRRPLALLQAQASATGWMMPRWFTVEGVAGVALLLGLLVV